MASPGADFSALQAPPAPARRGIVAIHASDDRYADDVHYIGGCVLASDMVHWSACMTAYAGQPPDPAVAGDGRRDAWACSAGVDGAMGGHVARAPAPRRLLAPGLGLLTASATELAERNVVRQRLVEGDPLSARAAGEVDVELARGDWRTRVEVRSTMTCDGERFLVTTELDAYEGASRSFARRWTHEIARDGG